MVYALADATHALEALSTMAHVAAASDGIHMLAAMAHARVLSGRDHLKVEPSKPSNPQNSQP
jgi:hypothetical protein